MKEKYAKYMPSRRFTTIMGGIAVLILIIFILFFVFSGKASFILGDNFNTKNFQNFFSTSNDITVNDLLNIDTDKDGVPDWEESLWGTDKNNKETFGIPDSTYIANRKKELRNEYGEIAENEEQTETERFAREFFSGFIAMREVGGMNAETISEFSAALGQKVVNEKLGNIYSENDISSEIADNPENWNSYYKKMKLAFEKRVAEDGLGDEVRIISEGMDAYEKSGAIPKEYEHLALISQSYISFAEEIMRLPVPSGLKAHHLNIANSARNSGVAVGKMEKMITDPIVGIVGLSQYQEHSVELVGAVEGLETILGL